MGVPIACSCTASFCEIWFFRLFSLSTGFSAEQAGRPFACTACFLRENGLFSAYFPFFTGFFGSRIGWAPLLPPPTANFIARKWLFFANFSYSASCFRLRNRVGAPIALLLPPAYIARKWLFSPIFPILRLFSAQE